MLIRNGKWSLIGAKGAEFTHLKAGDIILTAQQTADILKNGKLRGRGTSVGGNAHADGTPLNQTVMFGGISRTFDSIDAISTKLVAGMADVNTSLDGIENGIASMAANISNITTNTNSSSTNITIGDIQLSEVQNVAYWLDPMYFM